MTGTVRACPVLVVGSLPLWDAGRRRAGTVTARSCPYSGSRPHRSRKRATPSPGPSLRPRACRSRPSASGYHGEIGGLRSLRIELTFVHPVGYVPDQ